MGYLIRKFVRIKSIFVLSFFLIICFSCGNPPLKSDIIGIGQDILKSVQSNDTLRIKKYFDKDTVDIINILWGIEEHSYLGNNFKYLGFDTLLRDNLILTEDKFGNDLKYSVHYFLIDTMINRLELIYSLDSLGNTKLFSGGFENLSIKCSSYLEQKFKPDDGNVIVNSVSWTNYGNRIRDFYIKLENRTIDADFENLKFQLNVYKHNQRIFSKKLVLDNIIYSGDMYNLRVDEIDNLYVEGGLNENDIDVEILLLESLHVPREFCETLSKVKIKYLK